MEEQSNFRLTVVIKMTILMIMLLLVIYFASLVFGYTPFSKSEAVNNSLCEIRNDAESADLLFEQHYQNLYEIADELRVMNSKKEIDKELRTYIGSEQFGDLRYFNDGVEYDVYGTVVETEVTPLIPELASANVKGCTKVYFDATVKTNCIAFYVPIKSSNYIDGILSILPVRQIIDVESILNPKSDMNCIIDTTGTILTSGYAEGVEYTMGTMICDFVLNASDSVEKHNEIYRSIADTQINAITLTIDGEEYVFAHKFLANTDYKFAIVSISKVSKLISTELSYIRQLIVVSSIALVALVLSLLFVNLFYKKSAKELTKKSFTDEILGCPNILGFQKQSKRILNDLTLRENHFVVLSIELRQYKYLYEKYGEEKLNEILKYMADILKKACNKYEIFGYQGSGNFVTLYHYASNTYITNKLKNINSLLNKFDFLIENDIAVKICAGACVIDNKKSRTLNQIIDNAKIARRYAHNNTNVVFELYTEKLNKEIVDNAKIEAQMEEALKNNEFRIFMQPKYNVKNDMVDSAEALVRWFDPRKGKYIYPGEFITLFEVNGFISKLDKHVFVLVCEYLEQAMNRGEKIIPVAVNVSRVTATSEDFIDFYVGNKRRHFIPDGVLTIEFTESFAMQDYETISEIVGKLHLNGIKCSIDDFGSGYSSFNILKNITMDELKLDRFFIQRGLNKERDNKLIKMVVDLAHSFNMSVVQEGVEEKEEFEFMKSIGCDVIQGYYFAKPMPLEEYKIFISSNTSIKYKSKVK